MQVRRSGVSKLFPPTRHFSHAWNLSKSVFGGWFINLSKTTTTKTLLYIIWLKDKLTQIKDVWVNKQKKKHVDYFILKNHFDECFNSWKTQLCIWALLIKEMIELSMKYDEWSLFLIHSFYVIQVPLTLTLHSKCTSIFNVHHPLITACCYCILNFIIFIC